MRGDMNVAPPTEGGWRVIESVGKGYLPKQAGVAGMSVEVRHATAVGSDMDALEGQARPPPSS